MTRPSSPVRLTNPHLTRRQLLQAAGMGAGAVALAPLLAACTSSTVPSADPFAGEPAGIVNFANWSLYIDRVKDEETGQSYIPSLRRFTEETGIRVDYRQVISDAETFYRAIEKWLAVGEPPGWDIMVITNGQTLTKLMKQGYLMELPTTGRPNFDANAGPAVTDPDYDPGNRFSMAWQSGITGIAYNPALTGREITSAQELFNPEFAGRVAMFGDLTDLPNFALLAAGIEPETSTVEDWRTAAALLENQRADGIVQGSYTQGYINALTNGEAAISMAWSGDIFQEVLKGAELEFVVPDEGAIIWTDTMCIPAQAQHPVDAFELMDFVYRPDIAGMIAAGAQYITPVPSAREEILKTAAAATGDLQGELEGIADSALVFPTSEDVARLHTYRVFESDEEETEWNDMFAPFQA